MTTTIRTVLTSGLFISLLWLPVGNVEAGRRRSVVAIPVPAVVPVVVNGGVMAAPTVVPMPVGSLATVRDFPGGIVYGAAYPRTVTPRAVRRVVRYGRSNVVGPRGYSAVISPWPLVPVTTPSKPYGQGVVPPAQVVAWQSPAGYFYRSNYQSPVMQPEFPMNCPYSPGIIEAVPPGSIDMPLEAIPAPPVEIGPQF